MLLVGLGTLDPAADADATDAATLVAADCADELLMMKVFAVKDPPLRLEVLDVDTNFACGPICAPKLYAWSAFARSPPVNSPLTSIGGRRGPYRCAASSCAPFGLS